MRLIYSERYIILTIVCLPALKDKSSAEKHAIRAFKRLLLNHSNMIAEENLPLNSLLYLTTKQKLHTLLYVKYCAYKLHPVDLQVWHDQQQREKQEWYIRVCVQIPLRKESFLYLKIFFLC